MSKRNYIKFFIALIILVSAGCKLPKNTTDSTQPPEEESILTPTSTVEVPTDFVSPDRCAYFTNLDMKFFIHQIVSGDTSMTMYVEMPGGVPGLEIEMLGDPGPFEYYAVVGGLESYHCNIEAYPNRLYCYFPFNNTYYDTAQLYALYVVGCDTPILGHPQLSLMVETPTPKPVNAPTPVNPCSFCHPGP